MTVATTYIPVTLTSFTHPERIMQPYTIKNSLPTVTDPAILSKDCPPYTGQIVTKIPGEPDAASSSLSGEPNGTTQYTSPASNTAQATKGLSSTSTSNGSYILDQGWTRSLESMLLLLSIFFLVMM
jgi:hypothetical protein